MTYDTPSHGSSRFEDTKRPPAAHAVDRRRRDFFIVDNCAVDELLATHGPYAFAVYCYLVRLASKEGRAYPSIKRICDATKISESHVRRMLAILQEERYLKLTPRFSSYGDQESNLYELEHLGEGGGSCQGEGVVPARHPNKEYTQSTNTPLPPEVVEGGGEDANASEEPNPYEEGLKRFAAYRQSLIHYFGRLETPREWSEIEETVRYWLKRGVPPLPPETFERYCKEEKDKVRARGDGMPRTTKLLLTRIAVEGERALERMGRE